MMDVDGVIVRGRPSDRRPWHAELETDLGLSYDRLTDCFFKPYWSEIVLGRVALRERLAPALARIAPHLTVNQVVQYWFAMDGWVDAALLAELNKLRKKGLSVHLATNQERERAAYLWDCVGLSEHFDGFHFSADLGARKPDASFFEAIVERTGLPPHEIMLVDDTVANIAGAQKAGWRTLLWTNAAQLVAAIQR